jgi:hypothetical protein
MMVLPLLDAAKPLTTVVDLRFVFVACVAFVAACALIWRPEAGWELAHRSGRRRASRFAIALLFFVAVLPAVLPYDHLFPGHSHIATGVEAAAHESHCHGSPGTCSDAPVPSGLGQLLMSAPLVVTPAMLAVLIAATATVLVGISFRPEVRPPLPLSA